MKDITHCHNEKPLYETDSGTVIEWDNPHIVKGEKNPPDFPIYHPVIIDIETSAELGQRPILCVTYDSLEKTLIVQYTHGYQDYIATENKINKMCEEMDVNSIIITNLSQTNFEDYVLRRVSNWNKNARERGDQNLKSLVAHNAAFDIPMLGGPNDGLLDNPRIGDQYEMSVQYKDIKMVGHRAGQFGQIYQFLDSANNYDSLYIPVGDTMVASQALWVPAKLSKSCAKMGVDLDVSEVDKHGNLSDEYVEYCINDVWATYLLYNKLTKRITNMFGHLPIEHIYSTASIGKFVLRKMGYRRVGYSENATSRIAQSYFGGRTDANITGEIVDNLRYTDILSEYPTVSELTGVWEYMKADYVTLEQIPINELPDYGDLREPENWHEIADYYVKIKPDGATLPVRTPHLEDTTKVVTANVNAEMDMMYHYMDIIAAQLIDGSADYEIKAAWKTQKHGKQDLQSHTVAGVEIKPEDNVMAKSIESRKIIQINQGYKDEKTKSLKITANSLYGCSAERIVKEFKDEKHDVASYNGFYNPHVATTITAGGRLMLALGEHLANNYGGKMVYCDTDSLILEDSIASNVIDDFSRLNPYEGKAGSLQMLEDEKGEIGRLFAVGTKKYIFFNSEGKILEVKEHGLGNYENLRDSETINRLWATIMYYSIGENPLNIDILYGKLEDNVFWSFNASTRSMRIMVNDMTNDYVRYGDWIQSTLTYDDNIRYMALNLTDKSKNDEVLKVKCEGEEIIEATTVKYKEMIGDKRLKNVNDIVQKFSVDAQGEDLKPDVNVTDLKVVTKEATSRKDIFISTLERQFTKNMSHINTILDEKI